VLNYIRREFFFLNLMEYFIKKSKYNPSKGLDDRYLSDLGRALSKDRSSEIEKIVKLNLDKAFKELAYEIRSDNKI
jgi:hypothetical protein